MSSSRPAARPPPCRPAPFLVNRRREREALEGRLREVGAGRGGVVVIEGEPGIGKSRLVRHLTDQATAQGFAVHAGTGDPIERGAPYHGWRPVLAGALGLDALPDQPTPGLSGEARAEATRDRLAELLGNRGRQAPTLVVLEDAHWLDSASLALALRLASAPGPLLLVLRLGEIDRSRELGAQAIAALDRPVPADGSAAVALAAAA